MPCKDKERNRIYHEQYNKQYYLDNGVDVRKNVAQNRDARRILLEHYKAKMGCSRCPESDPVCLDFHHINPTEKDGGIAHFISTCASWSEVLEEVKKCVVTCANCHRKHHRDERAKKL